MHELISCIMLSKKTLYVIITSIPDVMTRRPNKYTSYSPNLYTIVKK